MADWPHTIPHDLKAKLETLDGFRNPPGNQDRWGAIREWLVVHGVEAPEHLPAAPERSARDLGHSTPPRR